MAYPAPSLYTYRVRSVVGQSGEHYYSAQYSTDGGTTFKALVPRTFESSTEALQFIAYVVGDEAHFQRIVNGNVSINNPSQLAPTETVVSYP